MGTVTVVGGEDALTDLLTRRLAESPAVEACRRVAGGRESAFQDRAPCGEETVVYLAASRSADDGPDGADAASAFEWCRGAGVARVVLLSSAEIHPPGHKHPGLVSESHVSARAAEHPDAGRWVELESRAEGVLGEADGPELTVLRPVAVLMESASDYFSRLLSARVAATLPGHDPSLQFLSPDDLAGAVRHAVENPRAGVYHVAPDGVVPLRVALRLAGVRRVPIPRWVQRVARAVMAPAGLSQPAHRLERIRYSWTVSNERCKKRLGYEPQHSSVEVVRRLARRKHAPASHDSPDAGAEGVPGEPPGTLRGAATEEAGFDDFGMDKDYIDAFRRTLFAFLHDRYWRVETRGLDHLPRRGPAVLTGIHRGFMPWDGVMALHTIVGELGRYPRFLIHPGLVKFPFLFNYMRKLGGIIACRENADRVLRGDQILGVFPEGIRGAFSRYRDAYELGRFGRSEYVRMALRNRAPIVPFVTVGSAEIFPIFAKIQWRWWKRYTDWPCLPLTPTFPLLPLPLPSKWHTLFLEPIRVHENHPPEAADDEEIVAAINRDVKSRMTTSLHRMLERRRSVFFGSIFEEAETGSIFEEEGTGSSHEEETRSIFEEETRSSREEVA